MNFGFGISHSQRKPIGFPLNTMNMRQFSTYGIPSKKLDDIISKTGHLNVFNGPIVSNKCFSNPNFVNKNHPHILAPSVAGIVKFDTPNQNFCPPQKYDKNITSKHTETHFIENKSIPEKPSQEEKPTQVEKLITEPNKMEVVKIAHEPKSQRKFVDNCLSSPKMSRKNKRKKRNKNHNKGKSHKNKNKKCNSNKSKPWHKTNFDHEIMELSESTLDSDSSNMIDEPVAPFCITISSKTTPIDIKNDCFQNIIDKSDQSSMSISPCHHELLKSLSSVSILNKLDCTPCSPCSPKRKLRLPSECESEDSFIVFENDISDSDDDSCTDDSDFEDNSDSETDCDIEFSDNCDNRNSTRKQVSFDDSKLCTVHPMIKWGYAYRSARLGPWEQLARDRARFEARIRKTEETLSKVLSPNHREKIYKERFETP